MMNKSFGLAQIPRSYSSFIIHHSSFNVGFTLIEALVALSITAIVAVGVIGSVGAMMASSARHAEETTLSFLARAVAADVRLRGLPTERTGVFDSHPDHRWRLETTPFRDPAGAPAEEAPSLTEVLVEVTAPNSRSVSLKTLVRTTKPTESPRGDSRRDTEQ